MREREDERQASIFYGIEHAPDTIANQLPRYCVNKRTDFLDLFTKACKYF